MINAVLQKSEMSPGSLYDDNHCRFGLGNQALFPLGILNKSKSITEFVTVTQVKQLVKPPHSFPFCITIKQFLTKEKKRIVSFIV